MGLCVSSDHTDLEPAMTLEMSKTQNFVIKSPSPLKHKTTPFNGRNHRVAQDGLKCSPTTLHDSAGSREEAFFDSQAWLESDCEDDFLSVNGDFTPSRGNTPVRNTFPTRMGTPPVNRGERAPTFKLQLSPTHNKRKKLSDLFKESVRGARNVGEQNTLVDQNGNPSLSRANTVHSCERTPPLYGDSKSAREKSTRSVQCCLPSLLTSRSSHESNKKTNPVHSVQ